MWIAALSLALQPVAPLQALPVSPPSQSVAAYEREWRQAVSAWRACAFPFETYRYVREMAETLVQAKSDLASGEIAPETVEPEFSSYRRTSGGDCLSLIDGMEPIIAAYRDAENSPARLRPWRAPIAD